MRPISTPATLPEMTAKKIPAVAEDHQHQQGQADEYRGGGQIGDRQRALRPRPSTASSRRCRRARQTTRPPPSAGQRHQHERTVPISSAATAMPIAEAMLRGAGVPWNSPRHHRMIAWRRSSSSPPRADVGLVEVRPHTGDIADVVADVIGDNAEVAWIVLGNAGLDLADEIGADVGRLGEDAAADAGEQAIDDAPIEKPQTMAMSAMVPKR